MGRPYYIFGQFQETARCHDAQHGGRICCALAPQLVIFVVIAVLESAALSSASLCLFITTVTTASTIAFTFAQLL